MTTLKFQVALAALFTAFSLFAQKPEKFKWGEIPPADLAMTVYDKDSAATAVILQDLGEISVRSTGPKLNSLFKQHRRIKVFDVSAFKEGNLRIEYYSYKNSQRLNDLDIQLILPNGEKQKVKSDNVFTEKINKYWSAEKIFIPNLQKGCIIEYRYELSSENVYSLYDWYFQHELPVRLSQLKMHIPTYLEYIFLGNGLNDMGDIAEITNLGMQQFSDRVFTQTAMPAVKDEPFVNQVDDFRTHIKFQLKGLSIPGQPYQPILTTWQNLAEELDEHENFGKQIKKNSRQSDDIWAAFKSQINPEKDSVRHIAEKALRFVSQSIRWDERFGMFVSTNINEAFKNRSGNSADINLALLTLLQRAKLDAVPVLVSTRGHGQAYPQYPFTDQFNSVVVLLKNGSELLLLDATSAYMPLGEMRTEHYNEAGWMVDKNQPDWIQIPSAKASDVWLADMRLHTDGSMSGQITIAATGALARAFRAELNGDKPAEFIKKTFFASNADVVVDSVNVTHLDNFSESLMLKYYCRIPEVANVVNDFMYITPCFHAFFDENPFKSPKRNFPVQLPYELKNDFIINLSLPEGYKAEEMPNGERVSLPNNGGRTTINCSQPKPGMIQFTFRNKISQTHFEAQEYDGLRHFFDAMIKNKDTQIILKRL